MGAMEFSPRQIADLLNIARGVIRQTLMGRQAAAPECHDLDLYQPAGCFVSLHEHGGKLRGCVGRLDATEPLISALSSSAVSVLGDQRFQDQPVTWADLSKLEIELSVLSPLRPAPNVLAFEPKIDGIFLTFGPRTGCFLPQVARTTGWSREQLLDRLCTEKLGVPADSWKRPEARLSVFTAIVVGPEPFVHATISKSIANPVEV
jgi:AmmeMemoRadiSam system protein A